MPCITPATGEGNPILLLIFFAAAPAFFAYIQGGFGN
jgi:hypothetical protein